MKAKDMGFTVLVTILAIGIVVGIGGVALSDHDDDKIEEAGEEIIFYATQKEIDLTPNTPEKK